MYLLANARYIVGITRWLPILEVSFRNLGTETAYAHNSYHLLFFSSFLQITGCYFEIFYVRLIPHSLLVIFHSRHSH